MMRRRALWAELAAISALLLVAGGLRVDRLDQFIASDEVRWTCRAINFQSALREHRWADTFQVGHPGVVTMWLGGLALWGQPLGEWPVLCQTTQGGSDLSRLDDEPLAGVLRTLPPLLFRARAGVAVATTMLLLLVYLLLRWHLGLRAPVAACGLSLLALDPFLTAHSRVLHLDALTSLLALASLLAALGASTAGKRAWLLSGVLAGLAIASKSVALTLAGGVGVVAAWHSLGEGRPFFGIRGQGNRAGAAGDLASGRSLARRLPAVLGRLGWLWPAATNLTIWAAAALLTVAAIWPAMWVAPRATIQGVLGKALVEGAVPHESGNYFLGKPVADPGPLFYPLATAFRLMPSAWIGLACAALWLARQVRQRRSQRLPRGADRERPLAALGGMLAWAAIFTVLVTPGPKKFDRYLLPALSAANLAAGVGLGLLATLPRGSRNDIPTMERTRRSGEGAGSIAAPRARWPWRSRAAQGLVAVALIAEVGIAVAVHPYELAAYNPLVGGARVAQRVILVGWGEGYDLAADWLNGQPSAARLEVTVRGVANFAPLFEGRTRSADGYRAGTSDYVVLYLSQVQRRQNPALLAEYRESAGPPPAYVGRLAGIDFVWVYPNRSVELVRSCLRGRLEPEDVVVAGGETVFARHYDWPAPLVRFWGHWTDVEMRQALERDFPAGWQRAWLIRYRHEPAVAANALDSVGERVEELLLADGVVSVTEFRRRGHEAGPTGRTGQP